ncbi:hypothetical protein [Halarcobacter sp.]|uniref:hypothetical protein n=1 Tax=Halarcobacter sp. TaxID=2321133 RepID=UPI0029F52BD0|nr:hypothetical protein [Halarcobacter sp.]
MKHYIILIISLTFFLGCSVKNTQTNISNINITKTKIDMLTSEINSLNEYIDKEEARSLAFDTVTYSKYLAQKYEVVKPALFHNLLINLKIKDRGLCYHYANDLLKYLNTKKYKSFKLIKIVSSPGEYFEHTSLAVTTHRNKFDESIVLDAWRDSGELYFSKIKDDKKYDWELR